MHSKNKPKKTEIENRYVSLIMKHPCVVCGDDSRECHEFEQGMWFISIPLCIPCHRGDDGWHGDRGRWWRFKMTKEKAINITVGKAIKEMLQIGQ